MTGATLHVSPLFTDPEYLLKNLDTTGQSPAVIDSDGPMTYGKLLSDVVDARRRMISTGCADALVVIDAPLTYDVLVSMLAAWGLGNTLVPIDARLPKIQKRALASRLGAQWALDSGGLEETDYPPLERRDTRPAYVLFTSGSTGRPKAVAVSRQALVTRLIGLAKVLALDESDRTLALTPLSFDISLAEWALPLHVGGATILASPADRLNPPKMVRLLSSARITVVQATPSYWRWLLAATPGANWHVPRIWVGGEALMPDLAEKLSSHCDELFNLYGPTEAIIWATAWKVRAGQPVSLGSPLPDTQLKCVGHEQAQDLFEVHLGGATLADGYVNDVEATLSAFYRDDSGQRWYRTGDLVSYTPSGELEFRGRNDQQIKLRGERIELVAIETTALRTGLVNEACVIPLNLDDPSKARLRLAVGSSSISIPELRNALLAELPAPHVPAEIVKMDTLPRTTAGKVDRLALALIGEEGSVGP